MRKIILPAIFLLLCSSVFGQSLKLIEPDKNWEGSIGEKIKATIQIQNISNKPVTLVIQRVNSKIGTTQRTRFCWNGECLDPDVSKLVITQKLIPGEMTSNFTSILDAGLTEELSTVSYVIYNKDNPADAVSFDIHYSVKERATEDIFYESNDIQLKDVYPNPASETAFLDYHLKSEDSEAKIILHNVLGSVVGTYPLNFYESQLKIPVQDLNPGVYFYTLYLANRGIITKKLIIKK